MMKWPYVKEGEVFIEIGGLMIELPMQNGEVYKVVAIEQRDLQEAYPRLDVAGELKKMRQWLMANPRRRKKNMRAFITNWLNKARPTVQNAACRAPEPPPLPGYTAREDVVQRHIAEARRQLGMRS